MLITGWLAAGPTDRAGPATKSSRTNASEAYLQTLHTNTYLRAYRRAHTHTGDSNQPALIPTSHLQASELGLISEEYIYIDWRVQRLLGPFCRHNIQ